MKEEKESRFSNVKPADALGTLSRRARVSRLYAVLAAVLGFFVLAFVVGLLFQSVAGGENTPDIPTVDIKPSDF